MKSFLSKTIIYLINWQVKRLSTKKALQFLFKLDNYLYSLEGRMAVAYGKGFHTKHKHIKYHQFFIKNLKQNERVLDIGCGNGYVDYQIVKQKSGVKITGIDLNKNNIKLAQKKYSHPRLRFIYGDALKKLPEEKFDVVILSNVLEHIENRVKFLKKIMKQIKPKRLLIRVPCLERDWRVPLKKEVGIDYRLDKTHFIEYTQEKYFTEIRKAGLKTIQVEFRWGEIWRRGKAFAKAKLMSKRLKKLIIIIIIIAAAVTQLSYVSSYSVDLDQSQVLYLAWDFVDKGNFPIHGILNSHRTYNSPFFVWLYLVPMMLIKNTSWILFLPAFLLHLLVLLVLYKLGEKYFDYKVGLLTMILYAFSSRGLYFGHASWAQGLLAPFYILIIYSLFKWLIEKKPWYLAMVLFLTSFITGIHWAGIIIWGVVGFLVLIYRPKIKIKTLLIGMILVVVCWIPYFRFEQSRNFIDVLSLVKGPLPLTPATELTPFCKQDQNLIPKLEEKNKSFKDSFFKTIEQNVKPRSNLIYRGLRRGFLFFPGFFQSLKVGLSFQRPFTLREKLFRFITTLFFLLGLGVLLYRFFIKRTANKKELLLLLSFLLPSFLQNLSPFISLSRPDVSWLFYGSQMLIISYAFVIPNWSKRKTTKVFFFFSLGILLALVSYNAAKRIPLLIKKTPNAQRRMMAWIAEDLTEQNKNETSIRYDFLEDEKDWCWIVSYSLYHYTYYIGTQFDYLLLSLYGIKNTARAPDGWVSDPDYIILLSKGMSRYESDKEAYQIMNFGHHNVLKPLKP